MKRPYWVFVVLSVLLVGVQSVSAQAGGSRRGGVREVRTVAFEEMSMSDPFILADPMTRMYYMTGSGGSMWRSEDLKMWEGPFSVAQHDPNSWMGERPAIWAAELHFYKGKYYYFATFTNRDIIVDVVPDRYEVQRRASHVLMAESVMGPYTPMNDEIYLPENWSTLDGTLWIEDGTPYMVFCHEWMQTGHRHDGHDRAGARPEPVGRGAGDIVQGRRRSVVARDEFDRRDHLRHGIGWPRH